MWLFRTQFSSSHDCVQVTFETRQLNFQINVWCSSNFLEVFPLDLRLQILYGNTMGLCLCVSERNNNLDYWKYLKKLVKVDENHHMDNCFNRNCECVLGLQKVVKMTFIHSKWMYIRLNGLQNWNYWVDLPLKWAITRHTCSLKIFYGWVQKGECPYGWHLPTTRGRQ